MESDNLSTCHLPLATIFSYLLSLPYPLSLSLPLSTFHFPLSLYPLTPYTHTHYFISFTLYPLLSLRCLLSCYPSEHQALCDGAAAQATGAVYAPRDLPRCEKSRNRAAVKVQDPGV